MAFIQETSASDQLYLSFVNTFSCRQVAIEPKCIEDRLGGPFLWRWLIPEGIIMQCSSFPLLGSH